MAIADYTDTDASRDAQRVLPFIRNMPIPFNSVMFGPQPSREEVETETAVMLAQFTDFRAQEQHVTLSSDQSVSETVYERLVEEEQTAEDHSHRLPHRLNEALETYPYCSAIGCRLRQLADEFAESEERRTVRDLANTFDSNSITEANFSIILHELFINGIRLERIITLIYFCSDLLVKELAKKGGMRVEIFTWIWRFLRQRVCRWVYEHGGWQRVLSNMVPGFIAGAATVGLVALAIYMYQK